MIGQPATAPPEYPHGTRVLAICDLYDVEGTLDSDHDDLDGVVTVRVDDGEVLVLNGWLWIFEVLAPPQGADENFGKAIKASGRDGTCHRCSRITRQPARWESQRPRERRSPGL
jgi:hypothetical protein